MLDNICKGFQLAAVISQLATKYHVSEKTLWSDYERRGKWAPVIFALQHFSGFAEMQGTKVTLVEKGAWSIFHNGDNDSSKVGALKVILDSVEVRCNILLSCEVLSRIERIEKELAIKKQMEEKNRENQQGNNEAVSGS